MERSAVRDDHRVKYKVGSGYLIQTAERIEEDVEKVCWKTIVEVAKILPDDAMEIETKKEDESKAQVWKNKIEGILALMKEMSKGQKREEDDKVDIDRIAQESARHKEPERIQAAEAELFRKRAEINEIRARADGSLRLRSKRRDEERQEDVENNENDDGRKHGRLRKKDEGRSQRKEDRVS